MSHARHIAKLNEQANPKPVTNTIKVVNLLPTNNAEKTKRQERLEQLYAEQLKLEQLKLEENGDVNNSNTSNSDNVNTDSNNSNTNSNNSNNTNNSNNSNADHEEHKTTETKHESRADNLRQRCEVRDNSLMFSCPHCNGSITVELSETNCRIFRHGYYVKWIKTNKKKSTKKTKTEEEDSGEVKEEKKYELLSQINPHASLEECQELLKREDVIGCCKPFSIECSDNNYYVQTCDYL